MPTFQFSPNGQSSFPEAFPQTSHDAGIDPAFDSGMEELERQLSEYRLIDRD
jgi:hypothetical protein